MSQESGSRRRTVDRHHGLCPEAGHLPARVNVTRVHCRRVLNSQVGMCLTPGLPVISLPQALMQRAQWAGRIRLRTPP